jgi:Zn finger protein HypA/HybF involved in hydrogenase expression
MGVTPGQMSAALLPWTEDVLECGHCGHVVEVIRTHGKEIACPKCKRFEMWQYEPPNLPPPTYQ